MKKQLNIYLLVATVFASCELLKTEPEASISANNVIVDQASAEVALIGAYDAVESFEATGVVAWNNAADNVVLFSGQSVIIPALKAAGTAAFDPTSGGGYNNYYRGINRANSVIFSAGNLPDNLFTGSNKNRILGEAYFIRALAYFDLLRTYGGVPVVLLPSDNEYTQKGIKRSSRENTFRQIGDDLDMAEQLFGDAFSDRSRASLWSVYALKARYYLYTEQWDAAEEYATKLIEHPNLSLTAEISGFFTAQLSSESIFEIVFSNADKNPFYTYYLPANQGGRLDYIPNPELVAKLLDPETGGKRRQLIEQRTGDDLGVWVIREYNKQDGSSSIFVLRLPEQYLIRAEARLKKNAEDKDGAVADINAIRQRAGIAQLPVPATLSRDALLLAVEDERRYELAFDGHRYADVIRTGRAPALFGQYNDQYNDPRYWVFPFPYSALVADPDLEQNAGYN